MEHMRRNHWEEYELLEVGREDEEVSGHDEGAEENVLEEVPETGLVRTIQVQIREMSSRESLVPAEVRRLTNLQEMLAMARVAAIQEAKQQVERGPAVQQTRKRKPERAAEGPVRRSGRLEPERAAAVELATRPDVEDELVESQQKSEQELEDGLEVAGEPEEEDVSRAVADLLGALLDRVVSKWPLGKKCAVCGVVKRCAGNLASHMASMHTVSDLPLPCLKVFCSLSFPTQWELEQHRTQCKFTCSNGCNWSTTRSDRVLGHMKRCGGK
jgi:hypothetical protein